MGVVVKSRSKSLKDVSLTSVNNLEGILSQISKFNGNINTNRLKLSYKKEDKYIGISSSEFFKEHKDEVLYVKDLGPQISWRLVFLAEYLGPILVHTVMYRLSLSRQNVLKYSHSAGYNPQLNRVAYYLILVHYLKREFETLFVHSFSQSTMPLFNIFKNSFHYWVLNGLISLGYFGYGFLIPDVVLFPVYSKLRLNYLNKLIGLFVISELWNFYSHIQLRRWGDSQKRKGVTKRVPMDESLFRFLVAPNYTFEVFAWIWFTLLFKMNAFSLLFLAVSTVQMYLWAMKKNQKYGTKRAFLIPFVF
ncbi:trans-2-enoyl-CoA reductase (NADPH) TSC13 Ecym_5259 [Eremothecium cymbalariae DBVPG|uniref:3-oxo-5-alpha-steroid 4-dehydrogenase C-terminal domain-containing protein n=1 Tax=Eremothecium cymbalariae (strain CBS 270.75 / DBVPG 7215 / KCTC 17166 / NRRL Y-17582) TaxID=931890 RepID=I6ND83_ERECY|nr:hypothetical protein Ecym_5259 [Eremothecium cymbalariae DBVPG\